MSQQARASRSARARSGVSRRPYGVGLLEQEARSGTGVAEFVAEHAQRARSEVGVDQAVREAGRDGRRQAWAPPRRQSLSSSSARFQKEPCQTLPPHPNSLERADHHPAENEVECHKLYCT